MFGKATTPRSSYQFPKELVRPVLANGNSQLTPRNHGFEPVTGAHWTRTHSRSI